MPYAEVRSLTRTLAEFATRPRGDIQAVPNSDAIAIALLDTVGVAIAGQGTETLEILRGWVRDLPSIGAVPVWGTGERVSALDAALINGTSAHALDWDDVSPSLPIHPSVVLVPALLARAAQTDVSGQAFGHAFNVGAAVFRAVSEALPVNAALLKGWHNTSTTGRIAGVASLAALTGATAEETASALGIVASMAAGSVSNFGTMTKPLHAGLAARDALVALSLAGRGFTSNPTQLEDPLGFFAMLGEPSELALARFGERLDHWELDWPHDWSIKRHPSCYGTHHAADAAIKARSEVALEDIQSIESIDVAIYQPDVPIVVKGRPTTGLEAKFSIEYCVATALARGALSLSDFEDDALGDPLVDALVEKVHARGNPEADHRYADMSLTLTGGRVLDIRVDVTHGDSHDPMTMAELRAKFVDACGSAGWTRTRAESAADALLAVVGASSLAVLDGVLSE